jgi:transcriptional antiterminator
MPPENYKVIKIFNNNVVLAQHFNKEKVLIKKGLAYNKKCGDYIDYNTSLEKIFTIENSETSEKFNQLITRIDENLVGICEEIICMISSELNEKLNEEIHIRLIDHIAFTLHRIKNNDEIENPFIVEIETLYREEMNIAKKAVKLLEKKLNVLIPDGEIGFIALHIHSAKNKGNLSNTIKYAFICNSVVEFIEDELNVEIDKTSIDYCRFITHIHFALERITKNIPLKNDLLTSIKKTYKKSYKLAKKVTKMIEEDINMNISEEEIGYMTVHIERINNTIYK